jgi:Fe-S-cluster containining protein
LEGYLLNRVNGPDVACVFLDQATHHCTIYETRPLGCRLFDCGGAGREQLIELGILPPPSST